MNPKRNSRPETAPQAADIDRAARAMLARREYSVAELSARLKHRFPDAAATVDAVVAELRAGGWVCDRRFVESAVHARRARGDGPHKIRQWLRQRGISEDLIVELLDPGDTGWELELERARRKRFGEARPCDYRQWAKQASFLARRGFSAEQIRRVFPPPLD